MGYLVLARKCRPTQFEDVIGQEHITKTLQNAIVNERIAHAYLFCGPRGVGKTTTARLLAKALNCKDGPTSSPCGICHYCKEIADGVSLEVIEVDGASNNGVDQVRALTDTIKYNSSDNKYKVYIIDEVHMLSIAAFNALLKNLEEPPPKVVFIFATTEIHKVPETIQSRCQQFVFNLISLPVISDRLKKIIRDEGFEAEEEVFSLVAKASGGSMRDAESILEKIMTFCGESITIDKALDALGLVSRELFFKLSDAILAEDTKVCFEIVHSVVKEGRNLDKFIRETIDFFRNILFVNLSKENLNDQENDLPFDKRVYDLSSKFNEQQLLFVIETLCDLNKELKNSLSPRVMIEIAFVKLSHSRNILPIAHVIKKINAIESRLLSLKKLSNDDMVETETVIKKKKSEPLNLDHIVARWSDFLKYLDNKKHLFRSHLSDVEVINFENGMITFKFPESSVFSAKIIRSQEVEAVLARELTAFFNHSLKFEIELESLSNLNDNGHNIDDKKNNNIPEIKVDSNEFVDAAFDIFEGDIIDPSNNYQGRSSK